MKRLILLMTICLAFAPSFVCANDGYGYPFTGSYEATILGTPDALRAKSPDKVRIKELVVDVIPNLPKPDVFFYDEGLRCTFAYQDGKAPLIFLIAGTGANHHSSKVLAMMDEFYKAGYHVITLPSPTHPNFIISASRSHVPGDPAEDAEDLYKAMESAWGRVKEDIEVSDFSLGGYSLGGTQAAFVAKLDEERKSFNFRRVIMVNPAVNLYNSVTRIEELLDGIPGGPRKIGAFFNRMLARVTGFYRRGAFVEIDNEFFYAAYKAKLVSQEEAGALIGVAFRISSAGMIFASDVMTNGGYVVPKNRLLTSSDSLSDYFRVSIHLSFINYFDEYFYPYFQRRRPGLTRDAFIYSLGLQSIEEYLKSSAKFGVITNENDFILTAAEIDYLRRIFGERIKVYPRGGHCGNLEYRENMSYMINLAGFPK
jgi:hypothetical protein